MKNTYDNVFSQEYNIVGFLDKNLLTQWSCVKGITNTLTEKWISIFLIFFIITVTSSESSNCWNFVFFTDGYRIVIMSLLCLLHYAISKVLFDPKVTRAHDVIDQFLLQYFQNVILEIFRIFKNYMKFTKAACWIISNFHYRGNSTTLMIL